MEFSHFLSSYFPDPSYGGKRLFADMVEGSATCACSPARSPRPTS